VQATQIIRLLSADKNEKGDLFTRLCDDVFFALGYGVPVHDLAMPGREIDVMSQHRIEARQMCAECKAHQKKMGGDDVNKFRGALLSEQRRPGALPTTGYFLSLGGFTQTAIEQEKLHGKEAIIFLTPARIIEELEQGNYLVKDEKALDQAGRCAQAGGLQEAEVEKIELLGHPLGYIKAIYFATNKQLTHFALIHADGKALAQSEAKKIINADKSVAGILHSLEYLPPAAAPPTLKKQKQQAAEFYRRWLGEECGYMQLDGLPLDNHKGPKRPLLHKLYVPLRGELKLAASLPDESPAELFPFEPQASPFGTILQSHQHLAVLAAPGGGKSTLLKRLGLAYSSAERYREIPDNLPKKQWLPLFLRCRELRKHADKPISQLLRKLPKRIELPEELTDGFRAMLQEALQAGQVLLLVDGLDEITDEGNRRSFADNLRRFLVSYPQVAMVVTSRVAGFRIVSGVIGQVCREVELAPLTEDGIHALCLQWHLEVGKDSTQDKITAQKLADQIIANPSLFTLAQNPLLLTTLLAVRRNLGELPTNRADLYREAVKLLVRTWNVEGFAPMPEREAMAQLCYVACCMMERNIQQIPYELLVDFLVEAREVLAADLQHTQLSPESFIEQVEYRSSLLMRVGHERVNGRLQYVYEFRHLTFQEYLAAEGYVRKRHRRRREGKSLVDLLSEHLGEPHWEEVISLAAVLADDFEAEPLIELLVTMCRSSQVTYEQEAIPPFQAKILAQCLVDEVAIAPSLLRQALKQVARLSWSAVAGDYLLAIYRGRAGTMLQEITEQSFLSGEPGWEAFAAAYRRLCATSQIGDSAMGDIFDDATVFQPLLASVVGGLISSDPLQRIRSTFAFGELTNDASYLVNRRGDPYLGEMEPDHAQQIAGILQAMLRSSDQPSLYAAALAWQFDATSANLLHSTPFTAEDVLNLFEKWRTANSPYLAHQLAVTLITCAPIEPLFLEQYPATQEAINFLVSKLNLMRSLETNEDVTFWEAKATVLMGWYWRAPWNDAQLALMIDTLYSVKQPPYFFMRIEEAKRGASMLLALGEAGKEMLVKRNEELKQIASEPPF
jgi:hypothetical protein